MQPDSGGISLGRNGGFLDDVVKTVGMRGLVDEMVPHEKIGNWHEQQQ